MRDLAILLLSLQATLSLSLCIDAYIKSSIQKLESMSDLWRIGIYLSAVEIIIILILVVTVNHKRPRRRTRRK